MLWNRFSVCFVRSWSRDALKEIIFFTRECLKFNFFVLLFSSSFALNFSSSIFFSLPLGYKRLRQAREEKNKCIDPLLLCYFVPLPLVVLISPSPSLTHSSVWVVKKEFFFLYIIHRERCEAKNPSHRTMFFILILFFSWSIEQT